MSENRDPAAIHTHGLGTRLEHVIADHATLAEFPAPGVAGRLARAADTGIVYRDNSASWQVWVTPGGGGGGGLSTPTRWVTYDSGVTGGSHSAGAGVTVDWVLNSANTHNDPTSESFGDIAIQADGWYTVSGGLRLGASPPSTDYSAFQRELVIFRSFASGGDTLFSPIQDTDWAGVGSWKLSGVNQQEGQSDWSWFGYLLVGDVMRVNVNVLSQAGTAVSWSVVGGKMRIELVSDGTATIGSGAAVDRKILLQGDTVTGSTGTTKNVTFIVNSEVNNDFATLSVGPADTVTFSKSGYYAINASGSVYGTGVTNVRFVLVVPESEWGSSSGYSQGGAPGVGPFTTEPTQLAMASWTGWVDVGNTVFLQVFGEGASWSGYGSLAIYRIA